jgi:hypothetical protein
LTDSRGTGFQPVNPRGAEIHHRIYEIEYLGSGQLPNQAGGAQTAPGGPSVRQFRREKTGRQIAAARPLPADGMIRTFQSVHCRADTIPDLSVQKEESEVRRKAKRSIFMTFRIAVFYSDS